MDLKAAEGFVRLPIGFQRSEWPKSFFWRDAVPDQLSSFFDLWEATFIRAGPDHIMVNANLEYAASARYQCEFATLGREGSQELLRHPGRAQQPAALGAVFDFDPRDPGRHYMAV